MSNTFYVRIYTSNRRNDTVRLVSKPFIYYYYYFFCSPAAEVTKAEENYLRLFWFGSLPMDKERCNNYYDNYTPLH